jgi:hypothetical protein
LSVNKKSQWSEEDIWQLKGQEESLRVEFKAGKLVEKVESLWVADLSREISAFANTEGGILVLGVQEEKVGKTRVASDPDGVPAELGRDQLQRKLEGNIFPYLGGIRFHRVPMASLDGRAVFVIDVPQGTTAYQANDGRYYGRSEIEVKYLQDHEIRVRMTRGKVARASVALRSSRVILASETESDLRRTHADALAAFATDAEAAAPAHADAMLDLLNARHTPDSVEFELILKNEGEMTIRDPAIEFSEYWSSDSLGNLSADIRVSRYTMVGEVIYPGDERLVPAFKREWRLKRDHLITPHSHTCDWRVFLDNTPPSGGVLDLGQFLEDSRASANSGARML